MTITDHSLKKPRPHNVTDRHTVVRTLKRCLSKHVTFVGRTRACRFWRNQSSTLVAVSAAAGDGTNWQRDCSD